MVSWTYRIDEHLVKGGRAYFTHQYELESDNRAVRVHNLSFDLVHRDEDGRVCVYGDGLMLWGNRWTSRRPLNLIEERSGSSWGPLKVERGCRICRSQLVATQLPSGLDPDLDPYDVTVATAGLDLPHELSWTLMEQGLGNVGALLETTPAAVERLPTMTAKRVRLLRESLLLHRFEWDE